MEQSRYTVSKSPGCLQKSLSSVIWRWKETFHLIVHLVPKSMSTTVSADVVHAVCASLANKHTDILFAFKIYDRTVLICRTLWDIATLLYDDLCAHMKKKQKRVYM